MTKDYFELMTRALKHYAKTFEELKKDDEITKLGNSFIIKDLEDNAKKASEVADELLRIKINDTISDNQNMIKSAMESYLHDLNKSKKALRKKLSDRNMAIYSLRNINYEIQQVEEYLSEPTVYKENSEPLS